VNPCVLINVSIKKRLQQDKLTLYISQALSFQLHRFQPRSHFLDLTAFRLVRSCDVRQLHCLKQRRKGLVAEQSRI
jgi:hypothetical protein